MGIGMYAIFDFAERRMTSWSMRGMGMMQQAGGG
jgi:NitT/TauT family transport system permease protein